MKNILKVENLKTLLSDIKTVKNEYGNLRDKDRFNIFYALHKESDEVNLHSRFISYLLAKNSGHGKGDFFARIFFEIVLGFEDKLFINNFLKDYIVIPNEFNKTEFEEIDILLINKKLNHAIIIENKIYAKDSNHDNKPKDSGYRGQLERYYNTIKTGKYIKENEIKPTKHTLRDEECENINVFYLALTPPKEDSNPDNPYNISKGNIPEKPGVKVLLYRDKIIPWLENCLKEIEEKSILCKTINQYLILVKNMTKTNFPPKEEIENLRDIYSKDWETSQYLIENFKHVKWQTVSDFFDSLFKKLLDDNKFQNVKLYPNNDEERGKKITDLTFYNEDVNMGIWFEIGIEKFYISSSNNLSYGNEKTQEFMEFKDEIENIRFSDFFTDNTFKLINKKEMKKTIDKILEQILENEKISKFNL